ncbi:acetylornithine deacetylase [Halopolyspora algeriensis]|uniref:Probable succinyl-diaminopimelate desuccinylase n=1 Tax=Halopolyspora algeriensis TaxID=1500506 RepID=A0A368VGJ6_9ACTN|nr:ArgE/DapE family deacylase [Halopolyspora algeriensis]RCW38804.1 acetylornithine deacetylase [Halopolyspora algeriensis]TQM46684.1 acetylornithine deacetylase [Halopolyspora algeriensis]
MESAHSLTDTERRVLDSIDVPGILADLRELVAIPSVGGTAGEQEAQQWCASRLASLDLRVDHWRIDLDELAAEEDFPGQEVVRDTAFGCVGVLGNPHEEPALLLSGHTDVVPPGDLELWPDRDPYTLRLQQDRERGGRERGGIAAGRGTCDMKGGLAAVFGALAALRTAEVRLRRPLAVHTVPAEEDGGLGAFATLRRGHRGAACVLAEPSDGAIVAANAGSLTFRLEVPGYGTHGATRTRGVNAVEKLSGLLPVLRELETRRNADADPLLAHLESPYPLSIGVVRAGDWASTVPDLAIAEGRFGVRLDEKVAEAKTDFADTVARACAADPWLSEHPVRVSWPGGVFAAGRLPEGHPLLGETRDAVESAGAARPEALGAPYGTDLRHYAAAGIPTLQYGPGNVRYAHAHDEHVAVAELEHAARTYALLAIRRCGVAEESS